MSLVKVCECCGKDNAWALINPEYSEVCGECESDQSNAVGFFEGKYRLMATCVCGKKGPVNFDKDQYYCGGSPGCCP